MADEMPSTADVAEFIAAQQAEAPADVEPLEPALEGTPEDVVNEDAPDNDIPGVLGEDPDLSDLDPEVRVLAEQRIKDMRADYTRKGQEIAEIRKLADQYAGGDVAAMQQALEFTHRLQTDPEFRAALYQELHGQQGTPAPQAGNQADPDDLFEDDDIPSGMQSKLSSLEQRLEAYERQAQEQANEARQQALISQAAADLDRQMGDIRAANPDIQDKHVDEIYLFGHATGGDLIAAHELWRGIRNDAQAELIASKQAIPSSIGAGRPSAQAGSPQEPLTTLEQASAAATEYLTQMQQD